MRFETQKDLTREEFAIQKFVEHMESKYKSFAGCVFVKLGSFDLDYIVQLTNGKRITIEIKGVNGHGVDSLHVPFVSILKVQKMQLSINSEGFDASFIIFAYKDGLRYEEVKNLSGRFCWNGRTPRNGSSNDSEIIMTFDSTEFKAIRF